MQYDVIRTQGTIDPHRYKTVLAIAGMIIQWKKIRAREAISEDEYYYINRGYRFQSCIGNSPAALPNDRAKEGS
jgi:hypothetical protein